MAKAGARNATAFSPDDISIPMALTGNVLCFARDVSAYSGAPNANRCDYDRNLGGNYCHRGGGASSRSDAVLTNRLAFPVRGRTYAGIVDETWRAGIWTASG